MQALKLIPGQITGFINENDWEIVQIQITGIVTDKPKPPLLRLYLSNNAVHLFDVSFSNENLPIALYYLDFIPGDGNIYLPLVKKQIPAYCYLLLTIENPGASSITAVLQYK